MKKLLNKVLGYLVTTVNRTQFRKKAGHVVGWLTAHKKGIALHANNLGVAGYTGAYLEVILNGFGINPVLLLVTGVALTVLAEKLKK